MAASTSEQVVPDLFQEVIDDTSSSSSGFSSIVYDSCGMVGEHSFPFSKEIVRDLLGNLDYGDGISLGLLLIEDVNNTFKKLLESQKPAELVIEWLLAQRDGCWENKLLESLYIIQNYQMLGHLVKNVENEKHQFSLDSPYTALYVNSTRKALYLMCEELNANELNELVQRVRKKCHIPGRSFSYEFMEMYIMYWNSYKCINLGDAEGQGIDLQVLKYVLESMNKPQLIDMLELSIQTLGVQRDGPNSIPQSLCMSPTVSAQANVPSAFQHNSLTYKIDPNNVGVCLIINQKTFHIEQNPQHQGFLLVKDGKVLETRLGTDIDRDRLIEIWYSRGFSVIVKQDLTHERLLDAIENVVKTMVKPEYSCFVLCILSHGEEGSVSGSNCVAVLKNEIDEYLTEAPNLLGKLKVTIIQACQGDRYQKVVWSDDIATDGPSSPRVRRGKGGFADMLTFWSTVPGFASLRYDIQGAWFIQELWKQMMISDSNEDITAIFTRVTDAVTSQWHREEGVYKAMVPFQCHTLTKILVLPHHPNRRIETFKLIYERFMFEALLKQYISTNRSKFLLHTNYRIENFKLIYEHFMFEALLKQYISTDKRKFLPLLLPRDS